MRQYILATALACLGATAQAESAAQGVTSTNTSVLAAWTQIMGSQGSTAPSGFTPVNLSMRMAINTTDTTCPDWKLAVKIPGNTETVVDAKLKARANQPGSGFDNVLVCQQMIDKDWETIRLLANDRTTPITVSNTTSTHPAVVLRGAGGLAKTTPSFAVLGDTGCRGQHGTRGAQACDPKTDPHPHQSMFRFQEVASKAVAQSPDFIIHLGDYRYNDEYMHTFDKWNGDFFSRVAHGPLMAQPWVFVRGNHEECYRAGHGWYYFFGPEDSTLTCHHGSQIVKPWAFDVGASDGTGAQSPHRFIIVGTSPSAKPSHPQLFETAQLDYGKALNWAQNPGWATGAKSNAWLVMHRPLWGLDTSNTGGKPKHMDYATYDAFEAAVKATSHTSCRPYDPSACGLKAVLAAHEHMFTNIVFKNTELPQQYVIGHSGVQLDAPPGPAGADGLSPAPCRVRMSSLGMHHRHRDAYVPEYRGRVPGHTASHGRYGNGAFGWVHFTRDTSEPSGWAGTAHYVDKASQALRNGNDPSIFANQVADCVVPTGPTLPAQ